MSSPLPRCALVAACALAFANSARADQFVITDVSWTHSADTTKDSHYRVSPSSQTPTNLASPVDYTKGSVRVALDVKTKPAGDTPTRFQVCFEGSPFYVCTDQSPIYMKTGRYVWTTEVANFYQGFDEKNPTVKGIDYTKPINKVALILKDTMNNKPQGDPRYVPTDLHIEVAWMTAGATYAAPGPVTDAGVAGRGRDASVADASTSDSDAGGHAAGDDEPRRPMLGVDAGANVVRGDATQDASTLTDGSDDEPAAPQSHDAGGCRLSNDGSRSEAALLFASFAMVLIRRRRRR